MEIKTIITVGSMAFAAMVAFATPMVTDVVAKQRYPWNGLVDITCKVSGIDGTTKWKFSVEAVMPDSVARKVSQFWVVKNGENSTDKKVQSNGSYKLLWDAQADLGAVIYSNMVMRVTVVDLRDKVQLWEGGPHWATTNIGAEEPWEYGYYFWWGDTIGYKYENGEWVASYGSSSNFSFWDINTPTYNKSIAELKSAGWITADSVLVPEHDAAHEHWGGSWRMPTDAELSELIANCTTQWITTNGVSGRLITGKGAYADKSIFLPSAGYGDDSYLDYPGSDGYYWSSTPHSDNSYGAWYIYFDSSSFGRSSSGRGYGQSVRPVRGFAQ